MPSRKRNRKKSPGNLVVMSEALWRIDDPRAVTMLSEEVFSISRLLPLIVVTTASDTGRPRIDVDGLVCSMSDYANVVVVENAQAAYALSDVLPDELRVYGGAVRLFWPNTTPEDRGSTHPLFITPTEDHGAATLQQIEDALAERGYVDPDEDEPAQANANAPWLEPHRETTLPVKAQREVDEARSLRGEIALMRSTLVQIQDENALLRKQVRGLSDSNAELENRLHSRSVYDDPAAQLEHEIWLAWLHSYPETDRVTYPLAPHRFGSRFVESVEAITGIEREKVVAACVDVLTRRAWEINGRKARQMRTSATGGAAVRVRVHDQATAWRCNLQTNTPSARRLMWWEVPDGSIELAVVALHDDVEFP